MIHADQQRQVCQFDDGFAACAFVPATTYLVKLPIMSNAPSAEGLSSPVGTSGRSEVDEDDEDLALEADSSGRSVTRPKPPAHTLAPKH